MKLIVGLGNPGEKYQMTRHNLGFMVAEQLLKDYKPVRDTVWTDEKRFKSDMVTLDWQPKIGPSERFMLVKPKTYMNNSGMVVSLISSFYKLDSSDIWIVHDELDLPVGSMKIRFGGAGAGHHGVEDIIKKLGTDKFWRFRLGIGGMKHSSRQMEEDGGKEKMMSKRKVNGVEDFVLGEFIGQERSKLKKLIKYGSQALQVALEKGIETAQNRFNTK